MKKYFVQVLWLDEWTLELVTTNSSAAKSRCSYLRSLGRECRVLVREEYVLDF